MARYSQDTFLSPDERGDGRPLFSLHGEIPFGAPSYRREMRSSSNPGSARSPLVSGLGSNSGSKPVQDSAILGAVRRQMDSLEEKLSGQISRVQQQNDRFRDLALTRVDTKVGSMEAMHPKLDRRIAELNGNLKGLTDELQAQIRRIDQVDGRLWEWRHGFEEEVRQKFSDFESTHQQLSSNMRLTQSTTDDLMKRMNKRLLHIESVIDERVASLEDTHVTIMNLHQRLECVEHHDMAIKLHSGGDNLNSGGGASLDHDSRFADVHQRLDQLLQAVHDNYTRVEAHEERIHSMKALFDSKDEQLRWLNDRVERFSVDGRLKDVMESHESNTRRLQDVHRGVCELTDHRQKHQEDLEGCRQQLEHLQLQLAQSTTAAGAAAGEESMRRVLDAEQRIMRIEDFFQPKVIEHEKKLQDMQTMVSRMDAFSRQLDTILLGQADREPGQVPMPQVAEQIEYLKQETKLQERKLQEMQTKVEHLLFGTSSSVQNYNFEHQCVSVPASPCNTICSTFSGAGVSLRVTIVQAFGLKKLNSITGSKCYCVCSFAKRGQTGKSASIGHVQKLACQTKTLNDTLEPRWDETLTIGPWQGETLTFIIYDKGALKTREQGKVLLRREKFYPFGIDGFDEELPIEGLEGAKLHLRINSE